MASEPGTDYWARMQLDERLALMRRDLPKTRYPSLQGWTREMARITDLIDVTIRSNSADPAAFQGLPRPITGIALLQRRERDSRMSRIIAKATPTEV